MGFPVLQQPAFLFPGRLQRFYQHWQLVSAPLPFQIRTHLGIALQILQQLLTVKQFTPCHVNVCANGIQRAHHRIVLHRRNQHMVSRL